MPRADIVKCIESKCRSATRTRAPLMTGTAFACNYNCNVNVRLHAPPGTRVRCRVCPRVENNDGKDRIVCTKCRWLVRGVELMIKHVWELGLVGPASLACQVHADCEFGPRAMGRLPADFVFKCWQCQLSVGAC